MKNEDKAREISNNYANSKLLLTPEECAAYTSAMIMAEWKDQQFQEEKKQWIESIIKWIKENNGVYWRPWMDDSGDFYRGDLMDDFYDDLRKAVKKGE